MVITTQSDAQCKLVCEYVSFWWVHKRPFSWWSIQEGDCKLMGDMSWMGVAQDIIMGAGQPPLQRRGELGC